MLTFREKDELLEEIRDRSEVKPMLTQLAEQLRAEDEIQGWSKGKAEGKVDGERSKAFEMALKLLKSQFQPDEIAELTGLSSEEVRQLRFL